MTPKKLTIINTTSGIIKRVSRYFFASILRKKYRDIFVYEGDNFCIGGNVSVHMSATVWWIPVAYYVI